MRFFSAESLSIEDAVQVIELVLDGDREQPIGLHFERLAVSIESPRLDALGALDLFGDAGEGGSPRSRPPGRPSR